MLTTQTKMRRTALRICLLALSLSVAVSANVQAHHDQDGAANTTNAKTRLIAKQLAPYSERDSKDEVFYFVLPDRFYNGNASNDQGAALGDSKRALSRGGLDVSHKGMYHGGDLQGLTQKLPYLEQMGISAIWLTPVLRNQAVQTGSAGYHGYWILDFTEIDPHLGSNQDLQQFIAAAHQRNIKVFFDIITNHTADVIKYQECHGQDGLGWLPKGNSCPFISLAEMAHGKQYTPLIPKGNEQLKSPAWLNNIDYYHNQGDSFWQGESALNGDFSGLDDVNTEHPDVVNGMIDIYQKIISEFKPDGLRIDTVKHVDMAFWQQFSPALIKHAHSLGINNFFMFGEVYSADPSLLSQYTTVGKLPSVLDFGLQDAIDKTLISQQGTQQLATLFAQDDKYQDQDSNANQLVSFISNHDMGRFAHRLQQSEFHYDEVQQLARIKLASALMFFSRGIPVIYYGDEQGFVGDGGDQDARQDMMPSRVASYNDDDLLGTDKTTADDNFDALHPLYQTMAEYATLYHQHAGLRSGAQRVLYAQTTPGIFAIDRVLNAEQDYLVLFNTANSVEPIPASISLNGYHLLYRSALTTDKAQLAPLSFALWQKRN